MLDRADRVKIDRTFAYENLRCVVILGSRLRPGL